MELLGYFVLAVLGFLYVVLSLKFPSSESGLEVSLTPMKVQSRGVLACALALFLAVPGYIVVRQVLRLPMGNAILAEALGMVLGLILYIVLKWSLLQRMDRIEKQHI